MHVCMYVCMFLCMYACIYIYIYMYKSTLQYEPPKGTLIQRTLDPHIASRLPYVIHEAFAREEAFELTL